MSSIWNYGLKLSARSIGACCSDDVGSHGEPTSYVFLRRSASPEKGHIELSHCR